MREIFKLDHLSEAALEAMEKLGDYMENPASRTEKKYKWAKVSHWYLSHLGLKGVPTRAPTKDELRGLREIIATRQLMRSQFGKDYKKSPKDFDLTKEKAAKAVTKAQGKIDKDLKQAFWDPKNGDMKAAAIYLEHSLAPDPLAPNKLEPFLVVNMVKKFQGNEPRSDLMRATTLENVYLLVDNVRVNARKRAGETGELVADRTTKNAYDDVRMNDVLSYMGGDVVPGSGLPDMFADIPDVVGVAP